MSLLNCTDSRISTTTFQQCTNGIYLLKASYPATIKDYLCCDGKTGLLQGNKTGFQVFASFEITYHG
jgi:hypothetical protein